LLLHKKPTPLLTLATQIFYNVLEVLANAMAYSNSFSIAAIMNQRLCHIKTTLKTEVNAHHNGMNQLLMFANVQPQTQQTEDQIQCGWN